MAIDPWEYLNIDPRLRPAQPTGQAPPITPLSREEEESLLSRISGKALGGLGYAGSVLDKAFGGRAVRGLLGGKPRELASILPFSDTLGITNEEEKVSGKELLGMEHDHDLGSTLAGIGAELALDPGTYASFGTTAAATAAGKVAAKVGLRPLAASARVTGTLRPLLAAKPELQGAAEIAAGGAKNLSGMLDQPLAGLLGLGLPLREPSIILGTGETGAKVLQGLSSLGSGASKVAHAIPGVGHAWDLAGKGLDAAGRYKNALFEQEALGYTSHEGQALAREASQRGKQYAAQRYGEVLNLAKDLKAGGAEQSGSTLRYLIEGHQLPPGVVATEAEHRVAAAARGLTDEEIKLAQAQGVNVQHLVDPAGTQFGPRGAALPAKSSPGHGGPRQPMVATDPRVEGREDIFKGFVEGTGGLEKLIKDPKVREGNLLEGAAHVRGNNYLADASLPGMMDPIKQSEALSDWVRKLDPQHWEMGYFANHPLADTHTYFDRTARLRSSGEAANQYLASKALDASVAGTVIPPNSVRATEALEKAGLGFREPAVMTPKGAPPPATQITPAQNAFLEHISKRLSRDVSPAEIGNFHVPEDAAAEVFRSMKAFSNPESLNPFIHGYDYLTNITKAFQTALWPAFHVRNFISGQFANLMKGGFSPSDVLNAKKLYEGGTIAEARLLPHMPAGLTDEQATAQLGQWMAQHELGRQGGPARELAAGQSTAGVGRSLDDVLSVVPGESPLTLGSSLAKLGQGQEHGPWRWAPNQIQGAGANRDINPLINAGRGVGDLVEGVNRGSLFINMVRQGHTPEQAAKHVLEAHFPYARSAHTGFENTVMKRLVPYYTYARHNIPFILNQMATHPGGWAGMEAKVAGGLRQDAGFLPDYLGSGLAIPLGGEEDGGTRRYLTRLDLPPEQAFEMLHGGPKGTENTLMAALGQMNPLIKGPLEAATGKQFFTGRDNADLYSVTGSPLLEGLLMNSPLSRVATTGRTLADERKWEDPYAIPLNLGTGARVSDVDMEKQKNIAAREYLTEMLRGQPEISKFETLGVKKGLEDRVTPQEMELLRLSRSLEKKAQEAAKKKVRVEGGKP